MSRLLHSTANHEIHVLNGVESSLKDWLDFVALCFAKKGTPREYFERQLLQIGSRDILILVPAGGGPNDILSTLCIFYLSFALGRVKCAGIGSVCTLPSHQKQGLAKELLKYTKDIFLKNAFVLDSKGLKITLLHSSKVALQKYYSHLGWDQTAVIRYGIWRIDTGGDGKTHMCTVRPATINDARRLKMLYGAFQNLLFLKDRSDADWKYILHERIKNKALFVCVQRDVIVAYASVTKYCNRHQLVEFAVADTHLDDPNKSQGCIESIVRYALLKNKGKESTNSKRSYLEVEIALKPSSEILGWKNIVPKNELDDVGWKFHTYTKDVENADKKITSLDDFFAWRIDNF